MRVTRHQHDSRHSHSFLSSIEIPVQQVLLTERMSRKLHSNTTVSPLTNVAVANSAAQSHSYRHENGQTGQSKEQFTEGFQKFIRRYESKHWW